MKFLVDAHLPATLNVFFKGHEVVHTSGLEHGNLTPDKDINSFSIMEKSILITKDTDFYYSYITARKPYKLVLVKLGNMRLSELKIYFQKNAPTIIKYLSSSSFLILEPTPIRILD